MPAIVTSIQESLEDLGSFYAHWLPVELESTDVEAFLGTLRSFALLLSLHRSILPELVGRTIHVVLGCPRLLKGTIVVVRRQGREPILENLERTNRLKSMIETHRPLIDGFFQTFPEVEQISMALS